MEKARGKAMVPVAKVSGSGEGICGDVLRELQGGKGPLDYAREFNPWNNGSSRGTVRGKQRTILLLLQTVEGYPINHCKGMKLEPGELRLAEAGNGRKHGVKYFKDGKEGAILFIPKGIPLENIPAYVDKIVKEVVFYFYENDQPVSTATESKRKHSSPSPPRRENGELRRRPVFAR